MDFNTLDTLKTGEIYNPYASKNTAGDWTHGAISTEFLNTHFGQYETATDMKEATTSEGLKLFFGWLVEQGKIPA